MKLEDLKQKVDRSLQEDYPSLKRALIEENRNNALQDSTEAINRRLNVSLQVKTFQPTKKPSDFVISNYELSENGKQVAFDRNSSGPNSRLLGEAKFQALGPPATSSAKREPGYQNNPELNLNSLSTESKLRQGINLSPSTIATQRKGRFSDPSSLYLPETQVKLHHGYKEFLFGPPANDIILMGLEKRQPRISLISRQPLSSGLIPTCVVSINQNCVCLGTSTGELLFSDFQVLSTVKVASQRINSLKADSEYIYCGFTSQDSDGLTVLESKDTTKKHVFSSGKNNKGTLAILHVKKPGTFTTVGLDGCLYYWSLSKSSVAPLKSVRLPIDGPVAGLSYKQSDSKVYFSTPSEIIELDEKTGLYRQFQNSAGAVGLDSNIESPGYLVSFDSRGLVRLWSLAEGK